MSSKTQIRTEAAKDLEILIPFSSARAMRIGSSTMTVVLVCLTALAFFSVTDFREVTYQRRDQDIARQHSQDSQELASFSQWLSEKERDLNRYLMMTGEQAETADPAQTRRPATYDSVRRSIERLENRIRILSDFQLRDEDYFWNVPSISPVALEEEFTLATGPITTQELKRGLSGVSSTHGMRFHPIDKKEEMHYGIDIFCPVGTTVRATANGTVTFVGKLDPNQDNLRHSYGNFVVVSHGDTGIETTYAHLSVINIVKGQLVKRGDTIAKSGNSGSSTGAHLHYAISRNGIRMNPLNYITDAPLVQYGKKVFYVRNMAKKGHKK
jgi:murein DD-endopeptidase MepM/ murein hydrolase activator NlpD